MAYGKIDQFYEIVTFWLFFYSTCNLIHHAQSVPLETSTDIAASDVTTPATSDTTTTTAANKIEHDTSPTSPADHNTTAPEPSTDVQNVEHDNTNPEHDNTNAEHDVTENKNLEVSTEHEAIEGEKNGNETESDTKDSLKQTMGIAQSVVDGVSYKLEKIRDLVSMTDGSEKSHMKKEKKMCKSTECTRKLKHVLKKQISKILDKLFDDSEEEIEEDYRKNVRRERAPISFNIQVS